jgi:hypothetical protein
VTATADWEAAFLEFLPDHLRPGTGDPRFITAALDAEGAGWSPWQAAAIVAGQDYANARVPSTVAVMRLEDLARRGPEQAPAHQKPCTVAGCFKGWIDHDGPTTPCPECRPQLARRIAMIPPPGRRSERDFAYLRDRA